MFQRGFLCPAVCILPLSRWLSVCIPWLGGSRSASLGLVALSLHSLDWWFSVCIPCPGGSQPASLGWCRCRVPCEDACSVRRKGSFTHGIRFFCIPCVRRPFLRTGHGVPSGQRPPPECGGTHPPYFSIGGACVGVVRIIVVWATRARILPSIPSRTSMARS